jgi:hypothetical protein
MEALPTNDDLDVDRDQSTAGRQLHGKLETHFDEAGYFVRVDWQPSA